MLPAYNEVRDMDELIRRIHAAMRGDGLEYRTVVVDDGSNDGTCDVVISLQKQFPVQLLKHEVNKGLGQALKTGFTRIASVADADDIVVVMDADNTHPPELIAKMNELVKNGADIVIASRYQKGAEVIGVPLYRRVLSNGASYMFRTMAPVKGVRDFTGGYRAYRVSLIKKALEKYGDKFITESGFSCMIEVLFKLSCFKPKIAEVPLTLSYDKKKGPSKMKIGCAIKGTLRLLVNHRLS